MGINYIYYPTIKLGFITIFTWGLFVAIGFLVGILLAARYGKKKGIKEDDVYGLCFYILLGAIIGSRLVYVISHPETYKDDILGVFKVWKGGLDFIGGLGGGLLAGYIFMKVKKLKFWTYADLVAPYIALGHAIGRIGCILGDGGHLGTPTNLLWGIVYEGVARHPTALYEMVALIILFIVLVKLRGKKMKEGMLFLSYTMGYSILRIGISFLRADPKYYGFTGTQWGLILASAIAVIFIFRIKKKSEVKEEKQEKKEEKTTQKQENKEETAPKQEENKDEFTIKE